MAAKQLAALRRAAEGQRDAVVDLAGWLGDVKRRDAALLRQRDAQLAPPSPASPPPSPPPVPPVAPPPPPPRLTSAPALDHGEAARARGNVAYRAGDWAGAAAHYTTAAGHARDAGARTALALALSNRAQVHLQLRAWAAAGADADDALVADPTLRKAWLRRAAALTAQGKHAAAARDLSVAVALATAASGGDAGGYTTVLSAQNTSVRGAAAVELRKAREQCRAAAGYAPSARMPVRRVARGVGEVDGGLDGRMSCFGGPALHAASATFQRLPGVHETAASPAPGGGEVCPGTSTRGTEPEPAPQPVPEPAPEHAALSAPEPAPDACVTAPSCAATALEMAGGASRPPATAAGGGGPLVPVPPLPTPYTAYEFERMWRALRPVASVPPRTPSLAPNADRRVELLLRAVDPTRLAGMYPVAMEPDMLGEVIRVLDAAVGAAGDEQACSEGESVGSGVRERACAVVAALRCTPQFSLSVALLADDEAAMLASLAGRLGLPEPTS